MRVPLKASLTAAALTAAAGMALAQGVAASAPVPTPVGVTPQTAAAANDRAVQRTDTGTIVRTGPTAANKAQQMGAGMATGGSTSNPAGAKAAGSTTTTNDVGGRTAPMADQQQSRPAKADRN